MKSSIIAADVTTHLRILFLALVSAFVVVWIGMNAHTTARQASEPETRIETPAPEISGVPTGFATVG